MARNHGGSYKVKDLFTQNGHPNALLCRDHLGMETLDECLRKVIHLSSGDDYCIWDLSPSGMFSFSSAWNLIRQRKPSSFISKHYWHKIVPAKISIFLWKHLNDGLPTNYAQRKKGIVITSKCLCCRNRPSSEFNTHLFLNSEVATIVWTFFSNLLNIDHNFHTLNHLLTHWWHICRGDNLFIWFLGCLPFVILWKLWKVRNKALYDDKHTDGSDLL